MPVMFWVLQARRRQMTLKRNSPSIHASGLVSSASQAILECMLPGLWCSPRRRGQSVNSQHSNGWVDDGSSSAGREEAEEGNQEHISEVEVALAQGIASSLRTLVIASFRAPPNKFVLGEKGGTCGGRGRNHSVPRGVAHEPKNGPL